MRDQNMESTDAASVPGGGGALLPSCAGGLHMPPIHLPPGWGVAVSGAINRTATSLRLGTTSLVHRSRVFYTRQMELHKQRQLEKQRVAAEMLQRAQAHLGTAGEVWECVA